MKHEFIINVRKKYKTNRDEALRCEILHIILSFSEKGNYSVEDLRNLLDDLEKIKYEEFFDYRFEYLDNTYTITTNCLTSILSSEAWDYITVEDLKVLREDIYITHEDFKSIEEHDRKFYPLL